MSDWRVFIESKPWMGKETLRIARFDGFAQTVDIVQPFVIKTYKQHEAIPEDDGALSGSTWMQDSDVGAFMQAMMDAAWERGLRPRGHADTTNELKAVRYHLEDMRKLAKVEK